jgi:hypothetical protein
VRIYVVGGGDVGTAFYSSVLEAKILRVKIGRAARERGPSSRKSFTGTFRAYSIQIAIGTRCCRIERQIDVGRNEILSIKNSIA